MPKDIFAHKLHKISQVFTISKLLNQSFSKDQISSYYDKNIWAYKLFYSRQGALHMGLTNKNGKNDLFGLTKIVEFQITKQTLSVLELACGQGANSVFLAKRHPLINFIGIDLSSGQLKEATKRSKNLINLTFKKQDYHQLEGLNQKFDLVFIFEALCHSPNKEQVLLEIKKKLNPGGLLIIADAYTAKNTLTDQEQTIINLIEMGMAVNKFTNIDSFNNQIQLQKFQVIEELDLSKNIRISLQKLEWLARGYFKFPTIARFLKNILPDEVIKNAISGYLMKDSIDQNLSTYRLHILKAN